MTAALPALARILLVEDSVNDKDLALVALNQSGLAKEVVWLRDGQEALDYLYRRGRFAHLPAGQPAVVLLDLKMPRVDGLQVLAAVKADSALRSIPIVMLTSSREERDVENAYRLGVNSYVVKPVEFDAFVAALKELGSYWAVLSAPPAGTVSAGQAAE